MLCGVLIGGNKTSVVNFVCIHNEHSRQDKAVKLGVFDKFEVLGDGAGT